MRFLLDKLLLLMQTFPSFPITSQQCDNNITTMWQQCDNNVTTMWQQYHNNVTANNVTNVTTMTQQSKQVVRSPLCVTFLGYSKDFVVFLFLDTFRIQKCLKTRKLQNLLKKISISRDFVISAVSRHFSYSKVSRNRKTTKSLEKIYFFKGFCCFPCF